MRETVANKLTITKNVFGEETVQNLTLTEKGDIWFTAHGVKEGRQVKKRFTKLKIESDTAMKLIRLAGSTFTNKLPCENSTAFDVVQVKIDGQVSNYVIEENQISNEFLNLLRKEITINKLFC